MPDPATSRAPPPATVTVGVVADATRGRDLAFQARSRMLHEDIGDRESSAIHFRSGLVQPLGVWRPLRLQDAGWQASGVFVRVRPTLVRLPRRRSKTTASNPLCETLRGCNRLCHNVSCDAAVEHVCPPVGMCGPCPPVRLGEALVAAGWSLVGPRSSPRSKYGPLLHAAQRHTSR